MSTETATDRTMVWVPGGSFDMGSAEFYAEEAPIHQVVVQAMWVDRTPVTNAEFSAFVADTSYVTTAEQPLDRETFPGLDDYSPGSMVFRPTSGPVDLNDWRAWWNWVPGATWRTPRGPDSDLSGLDTHPVVQVSFHDARAYAKWAEKSLPTEAEWEHMARGGLESATYAWGDELHPDGRLMANTWQGRFPYDNKGANGWAGTSPVGTFPPNQFGLLDVTGNVWEWTEEQWTDRHASSSASCCAPSAPGSGDERRRVLKGGSHLCSPEYCLRYRPAARSPETEASATTHIGFRCVRRSEAEHDTSTHLVR